MFDRVILLILDSVGVGNAPDAGLFNDEGANTIGNIALKKGGLNLPDLEKSGLGKIIPLKGLNPDIAADAAYGRMREVSVNKDTTTGHWEIAGLHIKDKFPVFENGFPPELIKLFEDKIGRKTLGNVPASGTEIIKELGEEHLKTGYPIIYTSADSVFQIAAHEEKAGLENIYKWCGIAREMLIDDWFVIRVIARPFIGEPGNFTRTPNRKDYSVKPFGKTVLDYLKEAGKDVFSIGKIKDIFASQGITKFVKTKSNLDGIEKMISELKTGDTHGLVFVNLVDFDMLYGHRRDYEGYYNSLKEFDSYFSEIKQNLKENDLLIITADHGSDPTFKGTDHTREMVPLIVCGPRVKKNIDLGARQTFSDVAKTIDDIFKLNKIKRGESFLKLIV